MLELTLCTELCKSVQNYSSFLVSNLDAKGILVDFLCKLALPRRHCCTLCSTEQQTNDLEIGW